MISILRHYQRKSRDSHNNFINAYKIVKLAITKPLQSHTNSLLNKARPALISQIGCIILWSSGKGSGKDRQGMVTTHHWKALKKYLQKLHIYTLYLQYLGILSIYLKNLGIYTLCVQNLGIYTLYLQYLCNCTLYLKYLHIYTLYLQYLGIKALY